MICPVCNAGLAVRYIGMDIVYICYDCGQVYRFTWTTTSNGGE